MFNNLHNAAIHGFSCFALLLIAGCGTLSQQQCLSGDWQSIGYNDGVNGHYPTRISQHQEACAKSGVIPDFNAWQRGRAKGLNYYCTAANARRLGQSGRRINSVCPASQINALQQINQQGLNDYQQRAEITRDKRQLRRYKNQLAKLQSGQMLHFKTEIEARAYMLQLQRNIIDLENKISRAEAGL